MWKNDVFFRYAEDITIGDDVLFQINSEFDSQQSHSGVKLYNARWQQFLNKISEITFVVKPYHLKQFIPGFPNF